MTYGGVAEAAGYPGGARLVVRVLRGAVGLPWHRVVASGGRIALAGTEGEEQRLRLQLEGVRFRGGRVRLDLHGWTGLDRRQGTRADPPARRRGGR